MTDKKDAFEDDYVNLGGRPTKYPQGDEERRKLFSEIIALGETGASNAKIAYSIGISKSTYYEWIKAHQGFSDAVKRANLAAQVVWEDIGMVLSRAGGGNATSWIFNMKNRFGDDYQDKKAIDHTSEDGSMTPQQTFYELPDNGRGDVINEDETSE